MNESYWITSTEETEYNRLEEDIRTDCLIIGGGIAGLTCHYLLTKGGHESVLIDADRIGRGCSGKSTGKIACQHGLVYANLERKFGLERARQYYNVNSRAIEFVENFIEQYNVDCGFRRLPAWLFTKDDRYVKKFEDEYETYKRLNIPSELADRVPIPLKVLKALKMENEAQFHPMRYMNALAKQCVRQKGAIYEKTRVTDFKPGHPCVVKTEAGPAITADRVVIASHFPCYDGMGLYFAKLKPVRTYAVMGRCDKDFPEAHFINAEDPTRSLRWVYEEESLLIVGESHKVGHQKDDYFAELKKFGEELYGIREYQYQWSAQDYDPPHQLPYVGYLTREHDNIYVATGFQKWGNSNGTAAGIVISNMILNGSSQYESLYDHPALSDVASSIVMMENADVAVQLISGKLKTGDPEIPDEKETGRIVNIDGKRCGYYRDGEGVEHILDITCTHLGCELKWNSLEKSWDCPCHGSRFDYKGNVLNGPAEISLNRYDVEKNRINPQIR